jgi:hypothetical protein
MVRRSSSLGSKIARAQWDLGRRLAKGILNDAVETINLLGSEAPLADCATFVGDLAIVRPRNKIRGILQAVERVYCLPGTATSRSLRVLELSDQSRLWASAHHQGAEYMPNSQRTKLL